MPKELQSSLDGPKWISSGSCHSRSKNISAPIKPKPQFRQQSGLGSSARRLFPNRPDWASDTINVRPASGTDLGRDHANAESSSVGDESVSNESDWLSTVADDNDDDSATPRPSRSVSQYRSVSRDHSILSDFVPHPPVASLVSDVRSVVNVVTRTGVSLASALVKQAPGSNSPSPSGSAEPPPPFSPPRFSSLPPSSLSPPPPRPPLQPLLSRPPVMATVLPLAKDINVKDVKDFDGSPANLSMFDTQMENALDR